MIITEKILIIICAVAVAMVAAVFLISYVVYRVAFYSPYKGQNDMENLPDGEQFEQNRDLIVSAVRKLASLPFERVEVTSNDGLKLVGRLYRGKIGAPVDICFHGYRGTGMKDFSMGGAFLIESGHNVIIVDERGCGESEGHTISFGINERKDAVVWCEKAAEIFGKECKIVLFGVSMGATTVLMALGEEDLPKNVICAVADCPFDSPSDIIKTVCRMRKYTVGMSYPFVKFGARVFVNENSAEIIPAAPLAPPVVPLSSHGDHRIAMALSLLCLITGGEIAGAEAVNKSYPNFYDDLRSLGASITFNNTL